MFINTIKSIFGSITRPYRRIQQLRLDRLYAVVNTMHTFIVASPIISFNFSQKKVTSRTNGICIEIVPFGIRYTKYVRRYDYIGLRTLQNFIDCYPELCKEIERDITMWVRLNAQAIHEKYDGLMNIPYHTSTHRNLPRPNHVYL